MQNVQLVFIETRDFTMSKEMYVILVHVCVCVHKRIPDLIQVVMRGMQLCID